MCLEDLFMKEIHVIVALGARNIWELDKLRVTQKYRFLTWFAQRTTLVFWKMHADCAKSGLATEYATLTSASRVEKITCITIVNGPGGLALARGENCKIFYIKKRSCVWSVVCHILSAMASMFANKKIVSDPSSSIQDCLLKKTKTSEIIQTIFVTCFLARKFFMIWWHNSNWTELTWIHKFNS